MKWINRRNVRKQFQRHEIARTTDQCLYGSPQHSGKRPTATKIAEYDNTSPSKSLMEVHDVVSDDGMQEDESYDEGSRRRKRSSTQFHQWECIPNVSHMELCVVTSPADASAAFPTSYTIHLIASMDESGVETSIHSTTKPTGSNEDPLATSGSQHVLT